MTAKKKGKKRSGPYEIAKASAMSVKEPMLALPVMVRKNMDIDAMLLSSARRVLGATTDTEAVNRALAEVSRAGTIIDAVDALRDAGGLDDVFGRLRD